MKRKILPLLLYALPLIFLGMVYFLKVVSGEDIVQGANSTSDILGDAIAAFGHSSRLSDMYAWAVIDFFDYQYSFGVDTIFRLVDVAMAFGIFYLMTDFVVGHRPRLELKDGLIFLGCFLVVILTPYGEPFYTGFSAIHNYLPMGLATLGFLMPYVHYLQGRKVPEKWWFVILMIIIGFLFGTISNLAPIAMGFAFAIQFVLKWIKKKSWREAIKAIQPWQIWGMFGMVVGVVICLVLGTGIENYEENSKYVALYDYVGLTEILREPVIILKHLAFNFGWFLLPVMIWVGMTIIFSRIATGRWRIEIDDTTKNSWIFFGIFMVAHVLIMIQIESLPRLMMPVYLVVILIPMRIFCQGLVWARKETAIGFATGAGVVMAIGLIILEGNILINYREKVGWMIERIENPEVEEFCVTPEMTRSMSLPFVYLGEEDFLADWSMPVTVEGTKIDYCR